MNFKKGPQPPKPSSDSNDSNDMVDSLLNSAVREYMTGKMQDHPVFKKMKKQMKGLMAKHMNSMADSFGVDKNEP